LQASGQDIGQVSAGSGGADGQLPFGFDGQGQSDRFDGVDYTVLDIAQQDDRGRTGSVMSKLRAQQTQLGAQVPFGSHLTTEINQRAQTTVLVAQASEAVGSQ
jgi:hypothetical protein